MYYQGVATTPWLPNGPLFISGGPTLFKGGFMAPLTLEPGTKVTVISGSYRGRRAIHQANVYDRSVDWPEPSSGFLLQLQNNEVEEERSIVVRCHQVRIGW